MRGYLTTFEGVFTRDDRAAPAVDQIEIPIIQRDYAQGRREPEVDAIRSTFLGVLRDALTGGEQVGLDFVYGEVEEGTLRPLDGQQRLTTLFLLHWYLAARRGRLHEHADWKRFGYATRPSARLFCQRLVTNPPGEDEQPVAAWITDQPWFLHVWRHDPSIQSMLVMIDAIHEYFREVDPDSAWDRLVDPEQPAISFYLLPIDDMGSDEDLYIKMNSRGKPLTDFETFKARFLKLIDWSPRSREVRRKLDGTWSDILWNYRDEEAQFDDQALRYFSYLIEICEWRDSIVTSGPPLPRAAELFGEHNPRAAEHLSFLEHAWDTWVDTDVAAELHALFTTRATVRSAEAPQAPQTPSPLLLFGRDPVDLFGHCCRSFVPTPRNRPFTLGQGLLLYAVILDRAQPHPEFPRRLRTLRNFVAAAGDAMRLENMPTLLEETTYLVQQGGLDQVQQFGPRQVEDELLKRELLTNHPGLRETVDDLEDHDLLRGNLGAFELDPELLPARAAAFADLFSDSTNWSGVSRVLLAHGEYQRRRWSRSKGFWFGTSSTLGTAVWRRVLTEAQREALSDVRRALMSMLDSYSTSGQTVERFLDTAAIPWLAQHEREGRLTWRYYMVKYDVMRDTESGIIVADDGVLGYRLCLMRRTQMNSWYRDPCLSAVVLESDVGDAVEEPWFFGSEMNPRVLRLPRSAAGMRCSEAGLVLHPPEERAQQSTFDGLCRDLEAEPLGEGAWLLRVPQQEHDGDLVDQQDRVQMGAAALQSLIAAGL